MSQKEPVRLCLCKKALDTFFCYDACKDSREVKLFKYKNYECKTRVSEKIPLRKQGEASRSCKKILSKK